MKNSKLIEKLEIRNVSVTLDNILQNSKSSSGGERDVNFLKYLVDNKLLTQMEAVLKRTNVGVGEEYYLERYKRINLESDKHFLCRTIIQDELKKLKIPTANNVDVGNMEVLRSNSNYDIVTEDFTCIIDVGLTPARNYFRGLTDLRVKNYLITTYFDDYIDDIIFYTFERADDARYIDAIKDYQDGFKQYIPNMSQQSDEMIY